MENNDTSIQRGCISAPDSDEPPSYARTVRTFVLRSGRMTDKQRHDYECLSAQWCLPYTGCCLNYTDTYENAEPLVVEIGFGMGKATAIIAGRTPRLNYLGIEVYPPGVGSLLGEIHTRGLANVRIIQHDAMEVLEHMIPDESVAAFHIFFPDPWPKKRHHKRRLVSRPRTDLLARKLSRGGYLYMATDWEEYGQSALEELTQTPGLANTCAAFAPRQEWRPETRFEAKGLRAERAIYELLFEKK